VASSPDHSFLASAPICLAIAGLVGIYLPCIR
jgi:hypothetical protein